MECTFRVGQKVVCVNAHNSRNLVEGQVYTVSEVIPRELHTRLGFKDMGVKLIEVSSFYSMVGFAASRFRPVVTRATDISIFKSMLNPSRVNEEA